MPNLRFLLMASFSGKVVYAASSLLMLPVFADLLGAEAIGLLGFFTTLLMALAVLDGGLTSAITRELAGRYEVFLRSPRRYLNFAHAITNSYLVLFIIIGLLVFALVAASAGILADRWLHFRVLKLASVEASIVMMGLFIGLNFPILILQGALTGREMQVAMNLLYCPYALLRTLGVLGVLRLIQHQGEQVTIDLFFRLQVLVQFIYLVCLLMAVYGHDGVSVLRIVPRWRVIRRGLRFSGGILLISLTSVLVVQLDKMYLSGVLPLEEYGGYALASTIAGVPYVFSAALHSVLFPRFSARVIAGDFYSVERVFCAAFTGLGGLMLIISVAVWMFSLNGLRLLFDESLAREASQFVPILLSGTALQALLIVPYALQLSFKWTTLALRINLVAIPVMAAAMFGLANTFGAVGVAWVWFGYNVFSFVATLYFVANRFSFLRPSIFHSFRAISVIGVLAIAVLGAIRLFVAPWVGDLFVSLIAAAGGVLVVCVAVRLFRNTVEAFG